MEPTAQTYGALLHAAARSRHLDVAKQVFGRMKVTGSAPCC